MTNQKGQALVTLLIFVATAMVIISGVIAVSIINTQATSQFTQGQRAYDTAEAGAEDAIEKLLRDQSFSALSPYTLQVGGNQANVTVTPAGTVTTKTVTSEGVSGNFKRKIQVIGTFNASGVYTITSWNEIDD